MQRHSKGHGQKGTSSERSKLATDQISDFQLRRHARMWMHVRNNTNLQVTPDDMQLFVSEKEAVAVVAGWFTPCVEDPDSGCWRKKPSPYKKVMRLREAWFLRLHGNSKRGYRKIWAHTELPALCDWSVWNGRAVKGPDKQTRHHPFRCELFHTGAQGYHSKCCRPSHLAYGSEARNTRVSSYLYSDMTAQQAFQRHLLSRARRGNPMAIDDLKVLDRYANDFVQYRFAFDQMYASRIVLSEKFGSAPSGLGWGW
jgi:hypothetical protein